MVPSGSVVNHSGCSDDHGWSGAHCSARSSATSRSSSRARLTKYAKSSAVPSFGWIASWPPSAEPMAHGNRRRQGPAIRVLLGPAIDLTDGVDGRQVHHVETHSGDAWQVVYGGQKSTVHRVAVGVPAARRPRKELVPRAVQGAAAVTHTR